MATKIGVIGAGGMLQYHAAGFVQGGGEIVAVADVAPGAAAAAAEKYDIPQSFESVDEMLEKSGCDAVSIIVPNKFHAPLAIQCMQAGKHVLCEKSLACNEQEAQEIANAVRSTGLTLMDAFHYRYHPLFERARTIYTSGELGAIRRIEASFHIPGQPAADDIRMMYKMGGGVTMDIGCYPISWIRHISGLEPEVLSTRVEVGPPEVDVFLEATMSLPNDIEVITSGDMRPNGKFRADLIVTGDLGQMRVVNPLIPQIGHELIVTVNNKTRREMFDRRASYGYQLDAFLSAVKTGLQPTTDAEDGVKQMRVIDACYRTAGLKPRGE